MRAALPPSQGWGTAVGRWPVPARARRPVPMAPARARARTCTRPRTARRAIGEWAGGFVENPLTTREERVLDGSPAGRSPAGRSSAGRSPAGRSPAGTLYSGGGSLAGAPAAGRAGISPRPGAGRAGPNAAGRARPTRFLARPSRYLRAALFAQPCGAARPAALPGSAHLRVLNVACGCGSGGAGTALQGGAARVHALTRVSSNDRIAAVEFTPVQHGDKLRSRIQVRGFPRLSMRYYLSLK